MSLKQDRSGARNATDIERKYANTIKSTKENVETLQEEREVDSFLSATSTNPVQNRVLTMILNNKVTKVNGKGLSSNDFTKYYITLINNLVTEKHNHDNKIILDNINEYVIETILFEESSTENIALDGNSYDYYDLYYSNNNYNKILKVKELGNLLLNISYINNGLINLCENVVIEATGITIGNRIKVIIQENGTITYVNNDNIIDTDKISIDKVVGYKVVRMEVENGTN